MSSSQFNGLPASFDPFTTHPFTNIDRATLQQAPLPSPYPRPINAYPSSPPLIAPSTSLPTAQTPMHAPQPQHASPPPTNSVAFPFQSPARAHIFEPFKLERASPDLQDVLAKKSVGSPGRAVPIKTGASDDAKAKGRSAIRACVWVIPFAIPSLCDLSSFLMSNTTSHKHSIPPLFPIHSTYTAFYCEENVYLLTKQFLENEEIRELWDVFAVFISNSTRTVALWKQKLQENVVIWDYHVILVIRPKPRFESDDEESDRKLKQDILGKAWVYDFDTSLEKPCTLSEYIAQTFPYSTRDTVWAIKEMYRSLFRVVPGQEYLDWFASDRSHMVEEEDENVFTRQEPDKPIMYKSRPPPYPVIVGIRARNAGILNNLMASFVDMDAKNGGVGDVYTLEGVAGFFGESTV